MKIKENKGITLIALVITIIVLLILAGVTINMVLGENGIIGQSQYAKQAQENADLKDAIETAKGEAAIASYGTQIPKTLSELTSIFTTLTQATYKNNVAKVEDGVPIPIGFAYVEGTKKDDGLIIVDGAGNEFVWVPVDGGVVDNASGKEYQTKVYLVNNSGDASQEPKTKVNEVEIPSASFPQEYNAMKTSVGIYRGFYVGRYETSWTGSKVASVKTTNANQVMTATTDLGDTWANVEGNTNHEATWYGLYQKQKELYRANDSVTSGMIYGSQWDAIMDWMKNIENPNVTGKKYIDDSTGMGHYCYEKGKLITKTEAPIATGSNDNYKVKNIYDLAGNYFEWSQEAGYIGHRVIFGDVYNNKGDKHSVSISEDNFPNIALNHRSSRIQLYIK